MIPFPINEETSDKFPINDGAVTATEKTTDSGIKNEMAISEIAIAN